MIYRGLIHSAAQPKEIEVVQNRVIVAKDIHEYSESVDDYVKVGFEYECYEYSLDEYMALMNAQNEELKQQLLNTQMALCEIYESLGGL